MGNGVAQRNRKIRQDSLREQLSEQCRFQHLLDNLKKIENLDPESPTFKNDLDKYKEANAQRLKLMGYYIPILKAVEHTGDGGGELTITTINYKDA